MRIFKNYIKLLRKLFRGRMEKSPDRIQKANEKADNDAGAWLYKTRGLEKKALPFCGIGTALELIQPARFSFHTGGQNWMEDKTMPVGTMFLTLEDPEYNGESWLYDVKVLIDGRKAIVDLSELADKVKYV